MLTLIVESSPSISESFVTRAPIFPDKEVFTESTLVDRLAKSFLLVSARVLASVAVVFAVLAVSCAAKAAAFALLASSTPF